jgi:hypothetical protein
MASDHYRDQHRTILGHFIPKKANKGIFKPPNEQPKPPTDDEARKSKSFAKWVKRTAASGGSDGC